MTVFTFGDCCCDCLPGDLPSRMTMAGALNEVLRANWVRVSQCCWASTFNFNNAWASVISAPCWSRNESYGRAWELAIYRAINQGPAPALQTSPIKADFCNDLASVMSPREVLASVVENWSQDISAKVFLISRLASIENRVLFAEVNCSGQIGLRFVWVSTASYQIRYVQGFPQTLLSSQACTITSDCYDPVNASGSIILTDEQIVQRLVDFVPNQGISAGNVQIRSAKVFDSLNLSAETFTPNALACSGSLPACVTLPTVAQNQIVANSSSVATTGPTRAEYGVMPPATTHGVRTVNYWSDSRLPTGFVRKDAIGTEAGTVGTSSLSTITFKSPFPSSCRKDLNFCLVTGNDSGAASVTLDQLGQTKQTSAGHSFSEVPYTPQSAVVSVPSWVINFG
jgi:hypothetical protein